MKQTLTNHSVKIPGDYWDIHCRGRQTLEYEVPWITPESVFRLDELVTKDMDVLEYGVGGSTLFFARRARSVVSFDNQPKWIGRVVSKVAWEGIDNVQITHIKDYEQFMKEFPDKKFNCVLIDSKRKFLNRDLILHECVGALKHQSIIVLDNYANRKMFPKTYCLRGESLFEYLELTNFVEELYNHEKWDGMGTRILRSSG